MEPKWTLVTLKQYPMFARSWVLDAFLYDMKDSLGMPFRSFKTLYNGIYYNANELDNLRSIIVSKLQEDINLIWELCSDWKFVCDALVEYTESLDGIDFSEYSDDYVMNLLDECVKRLRKSCSYIYLAVVLDKHLHDWLTELLDEKLKDDATKLSYFQVLSSPTKSTKLIESKARLKKIAEVVREKGFKGVEALIEEYTHDFRWMGYDTGAGADLTVNETKSKIESIMKHKEPAPGAKTRDEIIKELKLSDAENDLLDLMAELIYLRSNRAESNMIAGAHMRPLIEELAKRFNTTYEDIMQLTFDEIKDALPTKKLPLDEIHKRNEKQGMVMVDGIKTIYSGDEVKQVEEEVEIEEGLTELTGLVANHGRTRGHAKIVLTKKDFDKVEFGDILVTKMTSPDFVVILEKCGGIVTDVGGITCHAAVIARELNKPCITGTKYATKAIKDGDLIEVDANKGIVKIE